MKNNKIKYLLSEENVLLKKITADCKRYNR